MEGLVVLVITAVAFLAIGIWLVVMTVKGPKLPPGHKFVTEYAGNKAVVVVDKKVENFGNSITGKVEGFFVGDERFTGKDLALKCASAIAAVKKAFQEKGLPVADVSKVVFVFRSTEEFEKNAWSVGWAKSTSAYSEEWNGDFNAKRIQVVVMRSKFMKTVSERGQPALHELVHVFNRKAGRGDNHKHDDKALWKNFGEDTVESLSEKFFAELVQKNVG